MRDGKRATFALAGVLLAGAAVLNLPAAAQPGTGELESGPLVLVTGADLSYGGVRGQLIDHWNRERGHEDQQVEIVELPARADLQRAQMLAAAQAGDTSYDVFNLDLTWTAEFAENGAIEPLDESLLGPRDFFEPVIDSATYRRHDAGTEQLWAVPFNTDVGLLFYRKDLLDKVGLGPPKSWQDMTDALAKVRAYLVDTEGENESLRAAYTSQLRQYEGLTVNAVEVAAAAGEELTTLQGASRGLQALVAHFQGDDVILPESTTFDETGSLQAFRDGRVLFMRNWPFAYNVLAADPSFPPGTVGVTRLPTMVGDRPARAALGGQNLAVAENSTKPRLARALIRFLTSPASQTCLLERGGLVAARSGVYNTTARTHEECFLPAPAAGGTGDGEEILLDEAPGALATIGASLNDAVLRPETPYYSQVTDVIQGDVSSLLAAAKSNEPQEEIDAIGDELPAKIQDAFDGR